MSHTQVQIGEKSVKYRCARRSGGSGGGAERGGTHVGMRPMDVGMIGVTDVSDVTKVLLYDGCHVNTLRVKPYSRSVCDRPPPISFMSPVTIFGCHGDTAMLEGRKNIG